MLVDLVFFSEKVFNNSIFQIGNGVKTIIMGHIFIQTKFCVCGVEEQNLVFKNKCNQLLSFLR